MPPADSATLVAGRHAGAALRPISIAFADYDRTRPLIDGRVKPKGIALNATNKWVGDFCTRPVYEEYDAAEMSLSWYIADRDRGQNCIALPVFPLRDPITAFMYVRTDSSIAKPADLHGRRIGLQGYRFTINLLLRGLLQDFYGFEASQASWETCEAESNGYSIPKNIRCEVKKGRTPAQKLKDGDVDAIWCPRVPKEFQEREPWIRRLFPDALAEQHRFTQRVGFVPFSHALVMNRELAEREPWVARSLYDAFVESQRVADEVVMTEKMVSYVDSMFLLEQQAAVYGPNPFENGLTPSNRRVMELFVRYAHEQGYTSRRLSVDELFVAL